MLSNNSADIFCSYCKDINKVCLWAMKNNENLLTFHFSYLGNFDYLGNWVEGISLAVLEQSFKLSFKSRSGIQAESNLHHCH